jgi:hypothetical protein
MDERDGASFHPANVLYETGASFRLGKGFSAEMKHWCLHPVDTTGDVYEADEVRLIYTFGDRE